MLKLYTQYADFHGRDAKSRRQPKSTAHDQNHAKSHDDRKYVIILQRTEMLQQLVTPTSANFGFEARAP